MLRRLAALLLAAAHYCGLASAASTVHVLHLHGGDKYKEMGEIAFDNHFAYARRHNYAFGAPKAARDILHFIDPFVWSKMVLFLFVMREEVHRPDWMLWIDSDAVFTNHELSLDDVLDQVGGHGYDVVVAADLPSWDLNGGIIFVRNTEWSYNFMERLLDVSKDPWKRFHGDKEGMEQAAMRDMYVANTHDEKTHMLITPERHRMNAFAKTGDWRWGDFIMHNTGCPGSPGAMASDVAGCTRILLKYHCAFTTVAEARCAEFNDTSHSQVSILFRSVSEAAAAAMSNKQRDAFLSPADLEQVEALSGLVDKPLFVKALVGYAQAADSLCVVGFAAGHAAAAMLWANSRATVSVVDPTPKPWAAAAAAELSQLFGNRLAFNPAASPACGVLLINRGERATDALTPARGGIVLFADQAGASAFTRAHEVLTSSAEWSALKVS
jgi:hypothetical protein